MSITMIMQSYVTSVKHGSTLNVTVRIILTANIYKIVINHGIASLVPICSFHLKNQTFLAFISHKSYDLKNSKSSLILKPTPDLALLLNQFNSTITENKSDAENVI